MDSVGAKAPLSMNRKDLAMKWPKEAAWGESFSRGTPLFWKFIIGRGAHVAPPRSCKGTGALCGPYPALWECHPMLLVSAVR